MKSLFSGWQRPGLLSYSVAMRVLKQPSLQAQLTTSVTQMKLSCKYHRTEPGTRTLRLVKIKKSLMVGK